MRNITSVSILALALSLGAYNAQAADIIEEPFIEPVPIEEAYSGWYIRGDVGYIFESETSGDYAFWNQFPGYTGVDDVFDYTSIKLRDSVSVGVGAGYRFSDHLRADATVDYFKADVEGTASCISYVTASMGLAFENDCHYEDTSKAEIWTAMANAYVDLYSFGPVTPYIGAGVGFAHVAYDELRNEQVCGSDPACAGLTNFVGYHEGEDSFRFAASLSAGASVDITRNLKLDAGYRYTRISEGDAFGFDAADRATGASGVQGRDDGFDAHALRAGLRYEFN